MIIPTQATRVSAALTALAVAAISGCAINHSPPPHTVAAERTIDICYSSSVHSECSSVSVDEFADEMERRYEMEEIAQLEQQDDW